MALLKPTLLAMPAFDATKLQEFVFTVPTGSTQVTANRLKIINNTSGEEVYNELQQSYVLKHNLPADSLSNGIYYSAQIQTQDANEETSVWSDAIQFYCFSEPTLALTNIPSSGIIDNNSYNFTATYNQVEGELLNSYTFNLYNSLGIRIATSGVLYVGGSVTPPVSLNYTFSGLEDSTAYGIEVLGVTINNTVVTSGLVRFTAQYVQPNIFALVQLINNCDEGYITISSNIIDIEGVSSPDPPEYIDGEKIDLSEDGSYVEWNEGYNINGNFTMRVWGEHFKENSTIITIRNNEDAEDSLNRIILNYRYSDDKVFAECYIYNNSTIPYYVYSNLINQPSVDDQVFIWLRRIDNIYELKIENMGV